MLPHHTKKRRRRKKTTELPPTISGGANNASLEPSAEIPRPGRDVVTAKPRPSAAFKQEEQGVLLALREHLSCHRNADDENARRQREIDFFEDALRTPPAPPKKGVQHVSEADHDDDDDDDDDADIVPDQHIEDRDNNTTATSAENDDDDGLQLASSFVQIEDEPAVRPWTPKMAAQPTAPPDDDLFYDCFEHLPPPGDIAETAVGLELQSLRNVEQDGLYVPPRPVGFSAKTERFLIERLLATGNTEMVHITNGVRHLAGLGDGDGQPTQPGCVTTTTIYPRKVSHKVFTPIWFDSRAVDQREQLTNARQQLATTASGPVVRRPLKVLVHSITFAASNQSNAAEHSTIDEFRLAEQLLELYDRYQQRQRQHADGAIEQKLMAVRRILGAGDATALHDTEAYRRERRDLRARVHRERRSDRQMLRAILEQWKRLKEVRAEQGFAGTSLRLVIHTRAVDEAEDVRKWDADFNVELHEMLEEAVHAYEKAKKLQQQLHAEGGDNQLARNAPKAPDPDLLQNRLHDVYTKSRRHPGEPIIQLELSNSLSLAEQANQKQTKGFKVQLQVDKRVTESQVRMAKVVGSKVYLHAEFSVDIMETASCGIVMFEDTPAVIRNPDTWIELFLPLPHRHELYRDAHQMDMCFSTKSAHISGHVTLKLGWVDDVAAPSTMGTATASRTVLEPQIAKTVAAWYHDQNLDLMDPDVATLCEMVQGSTLHTAISLDDDRKSTAEAASNEPHGMFRLNEDLTAFCSRETITEDPRLSALIARYADVQRMKHDQIIPSVSREIEVAGSGADDDRLIEDPTWTDPIDVQRHRGKKYLLNVYRTIGQHCERLRRHSATQELLIGNEVPTFGSFFAQLRQILLGGGGGAPLDPQRHRPMSGMFAGAGPSLRSASATDRGGGAGGGDHCRLVVNVLRAQGIPCRTGSNGVGGAGSGSEARPSRSGSSGLAARKISSVSSSVFSHQQQLQRGVPLVRPYAVVSVRDKSLRTSTADGSNATWNEQLVVALSAASGSDPARDTLCVRLFDEVVEDLLADDDRTRANEIYQRISSRWLGEIRIPIWTILAEQRIEGTFEMTTPQICLGYAKASLASASGITTQPVTVPQIRSSIYLTLFIHVEPAFAMPTMNPSYLECTEMEAVSSRVQPWLMEFRERFPQRCFDPLVALSNGKRVCITRLVGAIDPPFERSDVTEFLIRRFVALIPGVRIGDMCTRLHGVWLANDQILSLLQASLKDLGTLLVSFYLALGWRAWLVLGRSLPHGDTAFVLLKADGQHYLIDPSSGQKYAANDARCPLRTVHAIVGPDNVWANQQTETRASQTRFNVANGRDWRALFDRGQPAPVGLVHNTSFAYTASDSTTDLAQIVRWKLMKKISAWRTHRRTVWNRNVNDTLFQMLVDLEEDVCFEYEARSTYADRLQHLQGLYQMSGYPVQMAYCSLAALVERVRATGIHLNADGRVEFALSVYVQPYPGNVLSVWVFLMALVPRN